MTFSKSSVSAVLVGLFAGWLTMGGAWFIAGRKGEDKTGSAPAIGITLVKGGAGNGAPQLTAGTTIDDPRISFRQLGRIAEKASLTDPVAAARAAMKIPGHDNREKYIETVLRTWGETNGKEAAEWAVKEYQGQKLGDALYYISDGWAETDPEGAGDWFLENSDGSVLEDAVWEVLEAWGRKDPEAAFEWSAKLDDYTKSSILFGLAEGWGAVDPVAAAAAGMEMGGELGYDFLTSLATQWAGSDPVSLGQWASSLLSEELRAGVLAELGETWAKTDPAAAAEWARALESAGDQRFLQGGIAIGWSEHDPGGALEWALDSVEDGEFLREIVDDIVFNWTNIDPAGTTEWLEQQEPGAQKDNVLEMFSDSVFSDDPFASIAWAMEISDADKRSEHLRNVAQDWFSMDGKGAIDEMRKLGVPADLIRELEGN